MKKQLLTGMVLCAAVSTFSQVSRISARPSAKVNIDVIKEQQYRLTLDERQTTARLTSPAQSVAQQKGASAPSVVNWSFLSGSMNAIGMTNSTSRPLQYNLALNAVSFIHRTSDTYTPNPAMPSAAKSGVILAEVSTNWGNSWDSTCIYANTTEWGRYPQGAIYNPASNTSLSNAYVVGSGVTVGASSFSGNWYASKKLNTFDNVAPTGPGEQQVYNFNASTFSLEMPKHGWAMHGFCATKDGRMRTLAFLGDNLQSSLDMRGIAVVTGTFNNSTASFDWSIDSLIPPLAMKPTNFPYLGQDAQMAWNESGTVGYVVGTGVMATASLSNRSYQPFIYKMDRTLSNTPTWTLMPSINFNLPTYSVVTDHLPWQPVTYPVVTGSSVALPFTNDFDIAVDARNDLHIGITFNSGATDHPDSLNYYSTYITSINPATSYLWGHTPGWRPYLYDFIGGTSTITNTWKVVVVDSISSEGPGQVSGQAGFNENPWNLGSSNQKLAMDSRLKMGRTPDGNFITFTWAESDSGYTNNAYKYNNLPDLKVRCMNISQYDIASGDEQNVTIHDPRVGGRATLHFMSPTTGTAAISSSSAGYTVDINTPITVTNSDPYSQETSNNTWYGGAAMQHTFANKTYSFVAPPPSGSITAIAKYTSSFDNSIIYPNPAHNSAMLSISLPENAQLEMTIVNAIGQTVKQINKSVHGGHNNVTLNLEGLAPGIYFVNIDSGEAKTIKKLVIN